VCGWRCALCARVSVRLRVRGPMMAASHRAARRSGGENDGGD
jgi:hypothetical protein